MTIRHKKGSIRIIGGKWRGRRLHFDIVKGLRPTKDMVRETVFNWLSPTMFDAVVLDLFAGSGALGFEALSRGAKQVLMVDQEKKVILNLKENAAKLGANAIDFLSAQMPQEFAKIAAQKFNLVFLDPPFHKGQIMPVCEALNNSGILAKNALIYIEAEKELAIAENIPSHWEIKKHKTSGDMQYCLVFC